jgi:hypothetical protein
VLSGATNLSAHPRPVIFVNVFKFYFLKKNF